MSIIDISYQGGIVDPRIISVILIILLIAENSIPLYSMETSYIENSNYIMIRINASSIPAIMDARADSITVKLFDGMKWYDVESYMVNGIKKAWFSGIIINTYASGRGITSNTSIYLKIPYNIQNRYTNEWPIDIALKRIHYRIIIDYKLSNGYRNSLYIFFDYNHSGYKYNYPNKMFNINNLEKMEILNTRLEHVNSYVIDHIKYKIIDYNVTYEEYLENIEKYLENTGEPPWYIEGGKSIPQPISHPNTPRPEEFYYIDIANNVILNKYAKDREYSVYVGSCIYDAKINLDIENVLDDKPSTFKITIKRIRINVKWSSYETNVMGYENITYTLQPDERAHYEISLSDLGLVSYECNSYYRYNITLHLEYGGIHIDRMYMGVIKDLTGGDDGPTPELKYVVHGWMQSNDLTGFKKGRGMALDTDEAVLFTTPVITSFYYPFSDELDDECGIHIILEYSTTTSEVFKVKINGVVEYETILKPQASGRSSIWIPISRFKDIVADAIYNGVKLTVSVETDLLQKTDESMRITTAYIKLPIHPELWKPASESFISTPYLMTYDTLYIYRTDKPELIATAGVFVEGIDYNMFKDGEYKDTFGSIIDVIASRILYSREYRDHEYYISMINVTVLYSKNYFGEISMVPGHSARIDGEEVNASTSYSLGSRRKVCSQRSEYGSHDSSIIGFVLYIVGKWIELIQNAYIQKDWGFIEDENYEGWCIVLNGNGFLYKQGHIELRNVINLLKQSRYDGVVIVKVEIAVDSNFGAIGSGHIEINVPIKHGRVTNPMEPQTLSRRNPFR